MKTHEEHLKENGFYYNASLLTLDEYNAIRGAMKAYALEACKKQREICVREVMYTYDNIVECSVIDNDSILNAPSPELK